MRPLPKFQYDVASAISRGRRAYQEDALIADFSIGADFGFAVLADGMGGHASGDIASKIIVTEVFSELKLQSGNKTNLSANIPEILREAALSANECINGHVSANPECSGMGATLVAPVLIDDHLFWISIGDSPLFLFRNGVLKQLNEDHSMAPQIDFMLETGLIEEDAAHNHPDRNCLTSVLIGDAIARIDCPRDPVKLLPDDVLVVASDGLQFLSDSEIQSLLKDIHLKPSAEIAAVLLNSLEELDDPDQDNISFSVIKIDRQNQAAQYPDPQFMAQADERSRFDNDRSQVGYLTSCASTVLRPMQALRGKLIRQDGTA